MAKTASLKNRTRSYSISPALARTRQRSEAAAMSGECTRPNRRTQAPPSCSSAGSAAMSFWLSFHQALLGPTGPHQLDDPSDLTCKDSTGQHAVDDPRLSCKQQVGVRVPLPAPNTADHGPEIIALLGRDPRRPQVVALSLLHRADTAGLSASYARALIAQFQAQPPAALQHNGRRPATTAEGSPEAGS